MVYAPSIHRPRSTSLQRSEQKGKLGRSSSDAISNEREQIGQRPLIIHAVPLPPAAGLEDSPLAGAGEADVEEEVDEDEEEDEVDDESLGLSAWAPFL